jgi:TetR/AcrR family transcriptional repressor of nem operon
MKATAVRAPENTRRKILEAAFDEFYRNGFQGSSLNRIVEEAGTTKGALFHHFEGKSDLGYAVVRELIHPRLKTRWSDPLAQTTDPVTEVKRLFRQCSKDESADGQLVNGCPLNNLAQEMSPLDEKFRQILEQIYITWRQALEGAFTRGIKAGTVRKDVSPLKVAAFIVAAQTGIVGIAKNAQSEELKTQSGQAFCDYLDSLRP